MVWWCAAAAVLCCTVLTPVYCADQPSPPRYLLYDVNLGEGFNLRRDVYHRLANLVKLLNDKGHKWTLVLPPWGKMYHWQNTKSAGTAIQWAHFFDVESMSRYIPVLEFEDYVQARGQPSVDRVLYLQRYAEGWSGNFEMKTDVRPCVDNPAGFYDNGNGTWHIPVPGYPHAFTRKFDCLSAQAEIDFFKDKLLRDYPEDAVYLARGEVLISGMYSEWSPEWWAARRSVRFSAALRQAGDAFRAKYLASRDKEDGTVLGGDWRQSAPEPGAARGGPYLGVHLRRRDYLHAHRADVPSLHHAAHSIDLECRQHGLKKVFVATDAPYYEFDELKAHLPDYQVYRFDPPEELLAQYGDGGVAVIDQWVCAHARVFVGTHHSTFTFRINEEREILGFDAETSFKRFCSEDDRDGKCEQPTKWRVKY